MAGAASAGVAAADGPAGVTATLRLLLLVTVAGRWSAATAGRTCGSAAGCASGLGSAAADAGVASAAGAGRGLGSGLRLRLRALRARVVRGSDAVGSATAGVWLAASLARVTRRGSATAGVAATLHAGEPAALLAALLWPRVRRVAGLALMGSGPGCSAAAGSTGGAAASGAASFATAAAGISAAAGDVMEAGCCGAVSSATGLAGCSAGASAACALPRRPPFLAAAAFRPFGRPALAAGFADGCSDGGPAS